MEAMSNALLNNSSDPAGAPPGHEAELHVVMVPFPLQGHINPMMELAKSLVLKHGARVTFLNNKHNHDCILRSFATPSPHAKLQLVWLDNGLAPDFDFPDDLYTRLRELSLATFTMKEPFKQLLQSLNQEKPQVSCVVFGDFCPWAHFAAMELGIMTIFFWTESVAVFSMYYHAPLLAANGFFPYDKKKFRPGCTEDDTEDYMVTYVPGIPSLHPSSFPTLLHIDDISDPSFACITDQFGILSECEGIIINSFEELEKDASQAIQVELPVPVYLVGPLMPSAFLDGSDKSDLSVGASLFVATNDCIGWLGSQKKHSVLYISFGSLVDPSPEDLVAIACGIKASKQPFLWVIRSISSLQSVCDILPRDFMEDTKEYGLIIPWAPQMQVLSHPSTGAFLTHCGWNSTIESLSMGVPMIACPIFADQLTNCTYVCEVWKVGMALKRQFDSMVVREDVERVVQTVLHEEEGKEMRKRACRLREAARQAVLGPGSSSNHIENFVQGMKTHSKTQFQM